MHKTSNCDLLSLLDALYPRIDVHQTAMATTLYDGLDLVGLLGHQVVSAY